MHEPALTYREVVRLPHVRPLLGAALCSRLAEQMLYGGVRLPSTPDANVVIAPLLGLPSLPVGAEGRSQP
ncbi:hypothetical protein SAMN05216553_102476 [Lentzea fradiae]|uniref:Uncharacterized protein n=1 Tax=Lentzea fradiae TaxID=200378 RepID=A0A1G7MS38_9PSEU|nr:hypothetical protein [Lentzea fradiae]SDF64534.1 hypothetical protein SAMN05216553_102476 [Lentzea fradiae]